jgi:hypothetical protein
MNRTRPMDNRKLVIFFLQGWLGSNLRYFSVRKHVPGLHMSLFLWWRMKHPSFLSTYSRNISLSLYILSSSLSKIFCAERRSECDCECSSPGSCEVRAWEKLFQQRCYWYESYSTMHIKSFFYSQFNISKFIITGVKWLGYVGPFCQSVNHQNIQALNSEVCMFACIVHLHFCI